ncbi:hypothetical protein [Gorillibacterium sp. sgz500922]|uniref:hypothetical protein n=1 Tax=Gorillibacterium sp. sgz500922 TaxID=3446694 RepID=UPI003F66B35E
MKEAIITDTSGLYVDVTLTSDSDLGVTPIYETPAPDEPDAEPAEPVLTSYRVAIPVTPGLYKPRFDLAAWEAYQAAITAAREDYAAAYAEWSTEDEETRGEPPMFTRPEPPTLWLEGLTPEEIAALHPEPQPSETDAIHLAIAELAQAQANDIDALQLALAEIATLLTGGEA